MLRQSSAFKWLSVLVVLFAMLAQPAQTQMDPIGRIMVESFDHSLEEWNHSPSAETFDGVTRLEARNFIQHDGEWDRLTLTARFRKIRYEFTCTVNFAADLNSGNNSYSETIPPPP